jgi:Flp pilus assembly protein TadG
MATLKPMLHCDDRGQAVIELALTLPLLLLVVLGIFDFGFMFQRYEIVTNAAREGARVGVLPGYSTTDAANRALNYLDAGGLGGASITTVASGSCNTSRAIAADTRCAAATVGTTTLPAVGGNPAKVVDQITVEVQYDYEFVFVGPLMDVFSSGLGTTRLRAVSTMRLEPD